MPRIDTSPTIAELPAQRSAKPATAAEGRARYFNTGNAFDIRLPSVPDHAFTAEPARALDPATPTGLIPCDMSDALGCGFPATSPLMLARYGRIRAGTSLTADFRASGVIVYVMVGDGATQCGSDRVVWGPGDVIVLPGGIAQRHSAGPEDAVLWIVTNEPQLAFDNLRPPGPGEAPTDVVHYRADEITRQIDLLYAVGSDAGSAGTALVFSSERREATGNVLPTLTVAMNSLPGGASQRPHRHNSVAVSLAIRGERCHSMIDGRRKPWSPWATSVTPPLAVHSHHNEGHGRALFLIVQDGGQYYHTRAMGFEFADG